MKYVGTGRPIHDAAAKAAGAARYAGDISLPHMAHLCLVRSTIPHGYIRAVHAEKALAVPGVYGVFHCFNTTERGFNRYCAGGAGLYPLCPLSGRPGGGCGCPGPGHGGAGRPAGGSGV